MGKVFECRSVVPGCEIVVHGESESETMIKAAEHARAVHGIEHLSEALKAKIRAAIKDG
jgi:predicted small metal-binding protein